MPTQCKPNLFATIFLIGLYPFTSVEISSKSLINYWLKYSEKRCLTILQKFVYSHWPMLRGKQMLILQNKSWDGNSQQQIYLQNVLQKKLINYMHTWKFKSSYLFAPSFSSIFWFNILSKYPQRYKLHINPGWNVQCIKRFEKYDHLQKKH